MAISDEALMLQIQQQKIRAFDTLVRRWEKPVLNHCYRMLGDRGLAEDLRQETFLRVYHSASRYRAEAKFATWIYRIATNLCFDALSTRKRHRETGLADYLDAENDSWNELVAPGRLPDEAAVRHEAANCVREALQKLPESLRVIVVLKHYEELTFREIAEILDLPVSTVKSRMAAGMERLGRMLGEHGAN